MKNAGLLWDDCIRTKERLRGIDLFVHHPCCPDRSFSYPTFRFLVWLKSPEETPSCPEVKEKVNRRPQKSVARPADFTPAILLYCARACHRLHPGQKYFAEEKEENASVGKKNS